MSVSEYLLSPMYYDHITFLDYNTKLFMIRSVLNRTEWSVIVCHQSQVNVESICRLSSCLKYLPPPCKNQCKINQV